MGKEDNACCGSGCGGRGWLCAIVMVAILLAGLYFIQTNAKSGPGGQIYISTNGSAYPPEHRTISVSGDATEKVDPDMITVTFDVQNDAATASDAQIKNAETATAAIAALKAMGIADKDIKTVSFTVDVKQESHYICQNTTSTSDCRWTYENVGYTARHTVAVNVYDMTKGGAVVDAVVAKGGNVDGIQFGLKPETLQVERNKLLQQASSAAKTKADAIATGAGVSVSKPLSLSEGYSYTPVNYRNYDLVAEAAAPTVTPISPGTIELTASVSATYEFQ